MDGGSCPPRRRHSDRFERQFCHGYNGAERCGLRRAHRARISAHPEAEKELLDGLPFIELKLVGAVDFQEYVEFTFGTDRMGVAKGMIEVIG